MSALPSIPTNTVAQTQGTHFKTININHNQTNHAVLITHQKDANTLKGWVIYIKICRARNPNKQVSLNRVTVNTLP